MTNGWTPTPTNPERLAYDAERRAYWEAAVLIYNWSKVFEPTESDADKLHELVEMCNTDPAHIAHATIQDWGETSAEYKQSQPYHNDLYPY
jgi:hypothetical protein